MGTNSSILTVLLTCCICAVASGQSVQIDREAHLDKLEGMWMGAAIANWTGKRTEGARTYPPFYTDADWQTLNPPIDFVVTQDPWKADDDTDIEYVYLHLLGAHNTTTLSPAQIRAGWQAHINRYIWVSNATARSLMNSGIEPPMTASAITNVNRLMIDAQLTTEFFGALAPGMAGKALEMADLPIRTTAGSHAIHASQVYVIMHALAPLADNTLTSPEQIEWLYEQARQYIPASSKVADIMDFVLAEYHASADLDDWEQTRDRIWSRYVDQDQANGFAYLTWYESSANFAAGMMSLLYGQGDYRRTVRIASLAGWDADNQAATLGGLLGLMQGRAAIEAAFPGVSISERFDILRTHNNLPDYRPGDSGAQDDFTQMAQRMIPIIDAAVEQAGGTVDPINGVWTVVSPVADRLMANPRWREQHRSRNIAVQKNELGATAISAGPSNPPSGRGVADLLYIMNATDLDASGVEPAPGVDRYYSSQGMTLAPDEQAWVGVAYDQNQSIDLVRFVEGQHFSNLPDDGGWFESIRLEVRIGNVWTEPALSSSDADHLDPTLPFQVIDFRFAFPMTVEAVRVVGAAGGSERFVTCAELDGLSPDGLRCAADLDRNGVLRSDDFFRFLELFFSGNADFNSDGLSNSADLFDFLGVFFSGC